MLVVICSSHQLTGGQQDSHELLKYLFDEMRKEEINVSCLLNTGSLYKFTKAVPYSIILLQRARESNHWLVFNKNFKCAMCFVTL